MRAYQLVGLLLLFLISSTKAYVADVEDIKDAERHSEINREMMMMERRLDQVNDLKENEARIENQPSLR